MRQILNIFQLANPHPNSLTYLNSTGYLHRSTIHNDNIIYISSYRINEYYAFL